MVLPAEDGTSSRRNSVSLLEATQHTSSPLLAPGTAPSDRIDITQAAQAAPTSAERRGSEDNGTIGDVLAKAVAFVAERVAATPRHRVHTPVPLPDAFTTAKLPLPSPASATSPTSPPRLEQPAEYALEQTDPSGSSIAAPSPQLDASNGVVGSSVLEVAIHRSAGSTEHPRASSSDSLPPLKRPAALVLDEPKMTVGIQPLVVDSDDTESRELREESKELSSVVVPAPVTAPEPVKVDDAVVAPLVLPAESPRSSADNGGRFGDVSQADLSTSAASTPSRRRLPGAG